MAVQVWIGEKPEHSNERRAIVALANGLERLDGLYLLLANFSVGGRNIDLVIIKQDAIFIIELKHCDGRIFGDVNGPWYVEGSNGERKRLNPGRKNPYNQVISYYYSLINFLNDRREQFLSPQKATSVDFRTCRRVVVIAPLIQEGSEIQTDWKVEVKGLDELPAYLVTERSSEIDLDEAEMLAIPQLLHCTRWTEINALLAGVLPTYDRPDQQAIQPATIEPDPATAAADVLDEPAAEPPATIGMRDRATRLLTTWTGRTMLVLVAMVLALSAALAARSSAGGALPAADQPALVVSTSLPAGGVEPGGFSNGQSCVWSGFQPVGRRLSSTGQWENVGVDGGAPGLAPDVIVTLDEVGFCAGQITITWSMRNNLADESIELPLTSQNITVRDALGNTYTIADTLSEPAVLVVAPRSKASGRAVIDRAVYPNASTLVIQLRTLPFGETTWLVPIAGQSGSG
ncbi:MAG TPA: nuclease-related domain-containing protein [Roseiflexaceae bacterium]|mgnify:FL=1|nr:nuclease-related domain-containing protein [Roseiflexaceae bacterium]